MEDLQKTCCFVERWNIPAGRGEGWFKEPAKGFENKPGFDGSGGVTRDPLKATRYRESEALAVVRALNHFNVFTDENFRWVATKHVFVKRV
jgi:hypothetical protein